MPSPASPAPSTRPARRGHGARWAWLVGLAVTLALLAWALHGVDPAALLEQARQADPWLLLVTVVLATLTFPLRTLRWQLILRDVTGSRLPLAPLWHATTIGFMANNLLPARAGEVARALVARERLPVRFSTALASIGVERAFDGVTLVGLMAVAIASPAFPRSATIGATSVAGLTTFAAALFGAALILAALVVRRPRPWLALLDRMSRAVLPERFAGRIMGTAEGLVAGLEVLRNPRRFLAVVAWSLLQWVINAASFALCFRAFGLAVPPEGAFLLQGILGFGVAVPAAAGYFGVFEAGTRATLALYGIDATRAVSYALTYHASTFLPITLLGLYSLSRLRLHLAQLRAAGEAPD